MLDGVQVRQGEWAIFGGWLAHWKAIWVTAAVYVRVTASAGCIAPDCPVSHELFRREKSCPYDTVFHQNSLTTCLWRSWLLWRRCHQSWKCSACCSFIGAASLTNLVVVDDEKSTFRLPCFMHVCLLFYRYITVISIVRFLKQVFYRPNQ